LKILTRVTTASLFVLASVLPALAEQEVQKNTPPEASGATLEMVPCFIAGLKERVSCGSIDLPLDYGTPEGVKIPIHVTVVPAISSTPEQDPFVIFAGGPGQAAGDYGGFVNQAFNEIQKKRDIILIDQRGTGKSYGMRCSSGELEDALIDPKEAAELCRADYDIDVRHFTLENVIRDTNEIRQRLGYNHLNLWGGSYGTKSVSLYLKRYPEQVRSIIVDGVLPPDQSLFLSAPASAERALGKLVADCKAQPSCAAAFPDFKKQVNDLVEQAASGDMAFKGIDPISGKYLELDLDFEIIVESIRSVMYGAEGTTVLPYVVNEAHGGNLTPLLASLMNGTAAADSMYMGATLSLLCGEDVANVTAGDAASAGEGSFARDSYYRIWSSSCEGWDYMRPSTSDFFSPATGDVPALILSGDLDPVTPPPLGERWLKGFPNGRHIIVAGTGHNTSHVGCMPELLGEFIENLDANALDISCLNYLKRLPLVVSANGNVE